MDTTLKEVRMPGKYFFYTLVIRGSGDLQKENLKFKISMSLKYSCYNSLHRWNVSYVSDILVHLLCQVNSLNNP